MAGKAWFGNKLDGMRAASSAVGETLCVPWGIPEKFPARTGKATRSIPVRRRCGGAKPERQAARPLYAPGP